MKCDVLIITGLYDELESLLALDETTGGDWTQEKDPNGFPYHSANFLTASNNLLTVAAAWSGAMGETAAATRSQKLIGYLSPLCLAMCGICAGNRKDTFLGDVIIASRVFSYDHGKRITTIDKKKQRKEETFREIESYNLKRDWAMEAQYFCSTVIQDKLAKLRPISIKSQSLWLLDTLHSHTVCKEGQPPQTHKEKSKYCPNWSQVIIYLEKGKFIKIRGNTIEITGKGINLVEEEKLRHDRFPAEDPKFKIICAPIATGKNVIQDPQIFTHLSKLERKIAGIEMEAAAIGYVAEQSDIPSIIVKAVSDFGDQDKDDNFRRFACQASAMVLLSFLKKHPPQELKLKHYSALPSSYAEEIAHQVFERLSNRFTLNSIKIGNSLQIGNSFFLCATSDNQKTIAIAINNTGLLVYTGSNTNELTESKNLYDNKKHKIEKIIRVNNFISLAIISANTKGIIPSYWEVKNSSHIDWEQIGWYVLDDTGKKHEVALEAIKVTTKIYENKERNEYSYIQGAIIVKVKQQTGNHKVEGPVLTKNEELIGLIVAKSDNALVVWPWASLNTCLAEAKIGIEEEIGHFPKRAQ